MLYQLSYFRIFNAAKVEKNIKIDNYVKIEDVDTPYLEPEHENEEYLEPEYDKVDYEAIDKQDELITDSSFRVNLQMDNILAEVGLASTSDEWVNPTEDKPLEIKEVREEDLRGAYYAKPSRTQLSQEEIEEMVNTICNVKGENTNREEVLTVNEPKLQDGNKVSLMDMGKEENVPNKNTGDSFYQNTDSANKKRNILDNVFTSPKINKPSDSMYKSTGRTANLKVVNTHPRYDLPKIIKVEFIDGKFTIGRATRTGELTGANYEFGAEITPISRIHAQIDINEDTFFIRDLGSSNGTFLNGVKLEANKQYAIKDGDKIAFAIAFSKNSIEYLFEA